MNSQDYRQSSDENFLCQNEYIACLNEINGDFNFEERGFLLVEYDTLNEVGVHHDAHHLFNYRSCF